MKKPSLLPRLAASLVALSSLTTLPATAATVPFTKALMYAFDPSAPGGDLQRTVHQQAGNTPPDAAAASLAHSGAWGSASGMAAADLAGGTLKSRATAQQDGTQTVYTQSNASFGDGFRTAGNNGSPFVWTPDAQARFSLTLSGMLDASPSLVDLSAGAFVLLSLYQPGTLDVNAPLASGPNLIGYYLYLLGNPNQQLQACNAGVCTQLVPTAYLGDLEGATNVVQNFNPGGDFDWVLLLGASGALYNPGTSYDMDLSHTLTFAYEGPQGSQTTPVSGLFNNFDVQDVPEPPLLALGMLALLGLQRATHHTTRRATTHSVSRG